MTNSKQVRKVKKCPSCLAGFSKEDIKGDCTCLMPSKLKKKREWLLKTPKDGHIVLIGDDVRILLYTLPTKRKK